MEHVDPWQLRVEQRAALQKRTRARRIKTWRRHKIPRSTLVSSLFTALDVNQDGGLNRDELTGFALMTGFQDDREDLFEEIDSLLDLCGTAENLHIPSEQITMEMLIRRNARKKITEKYFTTLISRKGILHMIKHELRRTLRYAISPEISGPLPRYGRSCKGLKHMKIYRYAQRRPRWIMWHKRSPPWLTDPMLCSDPRCPFKLHPELFSGM